jgi:hypothetical protein
MAGTKNTTSTRVADAGAAPATTVDVVFEGDGVKGIGLLELLAEEEAAGYSFESRARAYAEAIVATLLAVDYKTAKLKGMLTSPIDDYLSCHAISGNSDSTPRNSASLELFG